MESMTITQQLESQIKSISFSSNEISEIGFRKPGKFRPSYTLWGAAIGMTPGLVHFVLAGRSDDCDRVDCGDGYDQGKYLGGVMLTAVGGVIGLVIGTILGTELSSDQKVSCEF